MGREKNENKEYIALYENDIVVLQSKKKMLLKQVAEIDRKVLILSKYNRELKGREE
jgi:hypothetical protein